MSNGDKIINGMFWSFAERFCTQGVGLIISIILARLVLPEEYGIIAAAVIFTGLATSFVTGGFGNALIQRKDADNKDFSTLFWFNTVFSIAIFALIFVFAPYLARIFNDTYDRDLLVAVMRALGIGIIISSFSSFYKSILMKRLQFKKIFFLSLIGIVISAAVGIYMAYNGFGVWALVVQNLVSYFVSCIFYMIFSKWHPIFYFSMKKLKPLFR